MDAWRVVRFVASAVGYLDPTGACSGIGDVLGEQLIQPVTPIPQTPGIERFVGTGVVAVRALVAGKPILPLDRHVSIAAGEALGFLPSQRVAEVSVDEMLEVERCLAEACLDDIVRVGRAQAQRSLRELHNLTPGEIEAVCAMARRAATDRTRATAEEDRAIILLRLEHVAKDAVDTMDHRLHLLALREQGRVSGATRGQGDADPFRAFADAAKAAGAAENNKRLPAPSDAQDADGYDEEQ